MSRSLEPHPQSIRNQIKSRPLQGFELDVGDDKSFTGPEKGGWEPMADVKNKQALRDWLKEGIP